MYYECRYGKRDFHFIRRFFTTMPNTEILFPTIASPVQPIESLIPPLDLNRNSTNVQFSPIPHNKVLSIVCNTKGQD